MTPLWTPDVDTSPEVAQRLLQTQFPDLNSERLALLGVGWDNTAYLVEERLVFRFPRRQIAAGLLAQEVRILPLLASHLPLPIPISLYQGAPQDAYPYPFAGYALIPGSTACRIAWSDAERAQNATPLAQFLSALHRLPVLDAVRAWAPGDHIGKTDLAKRGPQLQERLLAIVPELEAIGMDLPALQELVARLAQTAPSSQPTCWVHGDLYARHLLVDAKRTLCGVIDWGDVHLGDPALDLSIAFSFLPPEARPAFCDAYGPIDAMTWRRAQFRALYYGAILMLYGKEIADASLQAVGEYALRNAIQL